MSKQTAYILSVVIWVVFFGAMALTYYVNHFIPHGPSYPTGEIICQNDDRGPCGEEYKEDMRGLAIPDWAKFLREYFVIVLISLGIAGFYFSAKAKDEDVTYE